VSAESDQHPSHHITVYECFNSLTWFSKWILGEFWIQWCSRIANEVETNSPRLANSLAVSFPMPMLAPVTTAVLPVRDTASITTETTVHTAVAF